MYFQIKKYITIILVATSTQQK